MSKEKQLKAIADWPDRRDRVTRTRIRRGLTSQSHVETPVSVTALVDYDAASFSPFAEDEEHASELYAAQAAADVQYHCDPGVTEQWSDRHNMTKRQLRRMRRMQQVSIPHWPVPLQDGSGVPSESINSLGRH